MWARINRLFCLKLRLPRQFKEQLHDANLRRGNDGFASLPKEGVLIIGVPKKCATCSCGRWVTGTTKCAVIGGAINLEAETDGASSYRDTPGYIVV